MNTELQNDLKPKSLNPWDDFLAFKDENEEIGHDAQMLMFSFLSEVERFQEMQDINKKGLAEKIRTSASYITQLFRGNKPLNFDTLAKIQKALKIKFKISAVPIESVSVSMDAGKISIQPKDMIFGKLVGGYSPFTPVKGGKYNDITVLQQVS
jgi:transcriptional regulator with XRE-family HTH domain